MLQPYILHFVSVKTWVVWQESLYDSVLGSAPCVWLSGFHATESIVTVISMSTWKHAQNLIGKTVIVTLCHLILVTCFTRVPHCDVA